MKFSDLPHALAVFATALWVGGMWAIAYLAVPVLFQTLADRQLAGLLAGKMFSLMAFVGLGCALYLLAYQLQQYGKFVWQQIPFRIVLVMLLLLAAGQFLLQPMMADLKLQALPLEVTQSTLAAEFKTLHGVASVLYLAQSLLGLALIFGLKRGLHAE
ncbi:MAG: DUF4149 domain-containing protein [Gallionellaceae bacterium]|nr:DUF4149 domain-containing protein [Gallionellaceae bacterium]